MWQNNGKPNEQKHGNAMEPLEALCVALLVIVSLSPIPGKIYGGLRV